MQYKYLSTLSLFIICLLVSCAKEEPRSSVPYFESFIPDGQGVIETSLYGIVVDKNDQPIVNALVTLNSGVEAMDVLTDDLGHFAFNEIQNRGVSAFLSIKSAGKFDAFRKYGVIPGRKSYTEIKVQDKNIMGTVSASVGGIVTNGNGAKVELPANGIVNASGSAYTGDVSVAMAWIDPSAADLASQMVGDLSAVDMEGNRKSLATYGMLQVELLDQSGDELNLADGATATLEFPVPIELQANAPATIPLWSYNEEAGTWIEEGRAVLANGVYRGSVTHFSSWNVDFMFDPIEITGQVKFNIEGKISEGGYFSIYVSSETIGRKGGWLCDDGSFRFYNFPKGEAFKIQVLDHCGNIKYDEMYGPFQNDEDLGEIEVERTSNMILVRGNALNCNTMAVEDGEISVKVNNKKLKFEIAQDGTFEFVLDVCEEATAEITLIDRASFLQAKYTVGDSQALWKLSDIELCEDVENYFFIRIDGVEKKYFNINTVLSYGIDSTSGVALRTFDISIYEEIGSNANSLFGITFYRHASLNELPYTRDILHFFAKKGQERYFLKNLGDIQVTIEGYKTLDFIRGRFTGIAMGGSNRETGIPVSGEFSLPF